ncbi:MAG: helix-turn-helix domain-containing protein [Pseudonocardiaceae bacterium]
MAVVSELLVAQEKNMEEISLDTANYPHGDQIDSWHQILTEYLVPFCVQPVPEIPFRGQLHRRHFGPVTVVATANTPSVNHRPRRLSAQAGDMRLALSLVLAGGDWVVSEDRSQRRLFPGDLVLWDLARPMTLTSITPVSGLSFLVPPRILGPHTDRLLTSAVTVLPTDGGLGALVKAYLRQITELPGDLRPDIATQLGSTTVDLIATYLADLVGAATGIDDAEGRTLFYQVKAHIEAHLGEPDLSPAMIAAAHHLSVRSLYNLFATEGDTVAGWIRQRRLERTRHDLTHPAQASTSITKVALRWGFIDSAHFSRAFKTAYGSSPRDYRRANTPPAAGP